MIRLITPEERRRRKNKKIDEYIYLTNKVLIGIIMGISIALLLDMVLW